MRKSTTGVIRWINVDALDLTGELLLKGFQGEKVVAVDQHVVEDILAIAAAGGGMVGFRRILHQHPRLKFRSLLLADPGQLKLLLLLLHDQFLSIRCGALGDRALPF